MQMIDQAMILNTSEKCQVGCCDKRKIEKTSDLICYQTLKMTQGLALHFAWPGKIQVHRGQMGQSV